MQNKDNEQPKITNIYKKKKLIKQMKKKENMLASIS